MERNIKDIGKMESKMVKGNFYLILIVRGGKENGQREKE